jgi:uncharacterized protein (TIGR02246 family)
MKYAIAIAFAAGTVATAARADVSVRNAAADEKSVNKLSTDWIEAWNRHDAAGMAGLFVEKGDLINPMGDVARGHEQVLKLFQQEQAGKLKSSTMSETCQPAKFLDAKVAQLDCEFSLKGVAGAEAPMHGYRTAVVLLEGDRWSIASMRAMVPRQVPEALPVNAAPIAAH